MSIPAPEPSAAPPRQAEQGRKRLLVVEDDPDVAESISALLGHSRLAISIASNGVEAIARAKQQRPQAMVLDVWLPVMDGFEVFRVLRGDPSLRSLRVIFISALATAETLKRGEGLGAFASFRKPFNEEELRRTVLEALELEEEPQQEPAPGH